MMMMSEGAAGTPSLTVGLLPRPPFRMTLLEALQLIGYSLGAMLPLWMGYLLFKQRLGVVAIQRLLLGLGVCMIGWHAGNLVVTLRSLFALDAVHWGIVLRVARSEERRAGKEGRQG